VIRARAIVFDLDGTLFDHLGSARAGLGEWLSAIGVHSTGALEEAWFDAEARHFLSWRDGQVGWNEQRRLRLREFLPLVGHSPGSDDELDALFVEGYFAAYRRSWAAFGDVEAALSALEERGFEFAILSNGSQDQQRDKLARLGLGRRVGPLFTPETIGAAKPRPEAFLAVCRALDREPSDVLYVGDEYATDVEASRAAGLRSVHLDRSALGQPPTDDRVGSLIELVDVVTPVRA
jgi:putative hydrolase of the HAD superfamily